MREGKESCGNSLKEKPKWIKCHVQSTAGHKREKGRLIILHDRNIPWYLYFEAEYGHEPEE